VNVGGNSAVSRADIAGTGIDDFILTGTVTGPGTGGAPPGVVYQYFDLAPARYTTITGATIYFSVPQEWLDRYRIAPEGVVLYRLTTAGWTALPTTSPGTKNGIVSFSAGTPGFSHFAIAGTPGSPAAIEATVTPTAQGTPVQREVTRKPVTVQTTVTPVSGHPVPPQPPSPSLLIIVAGVTAVGLLAVGAVLLRRWWIRRQNPALFRDYD
jgi:hypothetical protein